MAIVLRAQRRSATRPTDQPAWPPPAAAQYSPGAEARHAAPSGHRRVPPPAAPASTPGAARAAPSSALGRGFAAAAVAATAAVVAFGQS